MKLATALMITTAVLLSGCETLRFTPKPTDIPKVTAPTAAPLVLRDVNWRILTLEDLKKILAEQQANPDPNFALYVLDNGNFKNLNDNMVDIRRFTLEQQEIIRFYEKLEESRTNKGKK